MEVEIETMMNHFTLVGLAGRSRPPITRVPTHVEKHPFPLSVGCKAGWPFWKAIWQHLVNLKIPIVYNLILLKLKVGRFIVQALGYVASTQRCPVLVLRLPTASQIRRVIVCSDHLPMALGYFKKARLFFHCNHCLMEKQLPKYLIQIEDVTIKCQLLECVDIRMSRFQVEKKTPVGVVLVFMLTRNVSVIRWKCFQERFHHIKMACFLKGKQGYLARGNVSSCF